MPPMVATLVVSRLRLLGRLAAKRLRPMLDLHLDFVEQELRRRAWFATTELTAADIMKSFPLEAARYQASSPTGKGGRRLAREYSRPRCLQARP